MENLLLLALEAHHTDRNHHRRYELKIGKDLFGHWAISIRYSRAGGSGGNELKYGGNDADQLRAIVYDRLRRRLSAPGRIGCHYRLTGLSASAGVDPSFWLPPELLGQFV
jgi:hypothetical protein